MTKSIDAGERRAPGEAYVGLPGVFLAPPLETVTTDINDATRCPRPS